jgi:membrane protein YqaA with SNARE-associated domain
MGIGWIIAAAVWASGEATFFFIVPDVLLTLAALRHGLRAGLKLAVAAALCASLAGLGMSLWGAHDIGPARHAMLKIPAIGPDLLTRAQRETGENWPLHLVFGAMTGVPYKLYAIEAGARRINVAIFFVMSFVARFIRFALTIATAAAGQSVARRMRKPCWVYFGWGIAWVCLYVFYFTLRVWTDTT